MFCDLLVEIRRKNGYNGYHKNKLVTGGAHNVSEKKSGCFSVRGKQIPKESH